MTENTKKILEQIAKEFDKHLQNKKNNKQEEYALLPYLQKAYDDLKEQNIEDIAEKFKSIYEIYIENSIDSYLKAWLLSQAPISIIKPSIDMIAFAATDGRVYINPVFVNALIDYTIDKLTYNTSDINTILCSIISYIIAHEMLHIILQHPWKAKQIIKDKTSELFEQALNVEPNLSKVRQYLLKKLIHNELMAISNVAMDYIINTVVCNALYNNKTLLEILSDIKVINSHEILYDLLFDRKQLNYLKNLDILKQELDKIHETDNLQNKTWDEIFYIIYKYLDIEKLVKDVKQQKIKISVQPCGGGGLCNVDIDSLELEDIDLNEIDEIEIQSPNKRQLTDTHGNTIEIEEKDIIDITDGYLENSKDNQNNNQQQVSNRIQQNNADIKNQQKIKEMLNKLSNELSKHLMKQEGHGIGGVLREITGNLKTNKDSLFSVLSQFLKSIYGDGVDSTFSWERHSRRIRGLPGKQTYIQKNDFVVFFDVSGSITKHQLNVVASSILSLYERGIADSIVIYTFDDGLRDTFVLKEKSDINKFKKIKGGGGTKIVPAIENVENKILSDNIVIVFTDSALFDDVNQLRKSIIKLVNRTGNKIVWFHMDAGSIYNITDTIKKLNISDLVKPVYIDLNKNTVQYIAKQINKQTQQTNQKR